MTRNRLRWKTNKSMCTKLQVKSFLSRQVKTTTDSKEENKNTVFNLYRKQAQKQTGFVEEWFRVYGPQRGQALHSEPAGMAQGTTGFHDSLSVLIPGFPPSSTTNNKDRKEKEEWE